MSSTNKTTNYELSQFLGTDKPAWLSDYNTDMSKIDAQMKLNADAATAAQGDATAAGTAVGTLANLTTDAKTSAVAAINEVDSNANTAQNTANQAALDASSAGTTANNALTAINKFNLSSITEYKPSDMTASGGTMQGTTTAFTLAKDSTGSVFKLYGNLNVTPSATGTITITLPNTGITPDSDFSIVGCGIYTQNGTYAITTANIAVKSNGTMEVSCAVNANTTGVIRLFASLYFAVDFGDQPE